MSVTAKFLDAKSRSELERLAVVLGAQPLVG